MLATKGYAARSATSPLSPYDFQRRDPGAHDVLIDIQYCGVCHSDLHTVRDEWGGAQYPLVPGHEIVGRVHAVGSSVTRFKAGDTAGVGCFVDSCRQCENCRAGLQQFCDKGVTWTYNADGKDGTRTQGGYSSQVVVDENYVLRVAEGQPLERVAPLLCAGITTYSPLRHWKVSKGQRVGIVGLGGLGHMAVKIAVSMGADVTVLSTSPSKEADAKKLGAQHFAVTKGAGLAALAKQFHFILDTVSAPHDLNALLELLRVDGSMVLVGVPPQALPLQAFNLIGGRRQIGGSLIGGLAETQEMLDYCAKNKVLADVEVISIDRINEAYERMLKSDVRYRFVIDLKTLK